MAREKEAPVPHLIAFAALSVPLAWISRASLRQPGTHGFYRFFAWEAILGLFALNVRSWFRDPFSRHQAVSWTLLTVCLAPLVLGVRGLRAHGNQATSRPDDADLLAFEKTTALVDTGIYRYVRHPLYSSLLCLAWGIFFKAPSRLGGLLAGAATAALVATAKADEAECLRYFGPAYREYMASTKRFVPFVF
jgi:protein-S-isoprenylcysteine O-methyltransferase Ste14